MPTPAPLAVYLEAGTKRVFACAVQWPGWCRAGRGEEQALAALVDYAPRYAAVAAEAGLSLPAVSAERVEVLERVPGSMTTDFGAPGSVAALDHDPVPAAEARRTAALVRASWTLLDRVAAAAPAELRKGPRGGGRDRDKMLEHVLGAEVAYARKIGVRERQPQITDRAAVEALREAIVEVLTRRSDGSPVADKGWPARYAARRIAWHVLDHAWEMQDRSA